MNISNYGFLLNDIQIVDNVFIKTAKNENGYMKIEHEINFYDYISNNNINFPIPKVYYLDKKHHIIKLEYLKDYKTIEIIINDTNIDNLLPLIFKKLDILHLTNIISCKKKYQEALYDETCLKIINRYNQTKWNQIPSFTKINSVNGLKINSLNYYLDIIQSRLKEYINNKNQYYFTLIHGDTHLNNILINDNNIIMFIDPRGYFSKNELFGIKEYDYAKLLFGLAGYSAFDNMEVDKLDIQSGNLNIKFIQEYTYYFENKFTSRFKQFGNFTKLLVLTIWLGNNSCFISQEKKVMSLMIALYLCELLLFNDKYN